MSAGIFIKVKKKILSRFKFSNRIRIELNLMISLIMSKSKIYNYYFLFCIKENNQTNIDFSDISLIYFTKNDNVILFLIFQIKQKSSVIAEFFF